MTARNFEGIKNGTPLPDPRQVTVPSDIGELLDDYIDSTTSMLAELEAAALDYEAANNPEENAAAARRVLHKIKGESSMVAVDDVAELCHQAEFAFDELPDSEKTDMLLRFKDWLSEAIQNMQTGTAP